MTPFRQLLQGIVSETNHRSGGLNGNGNCSISQGLLLFPLLLLLGEGKVLHLVEDMPLLGHHALDLLEVDVDDVGGGGGGVAGGVPPLAPTVRRPGQW